MPAENPTARDALRLQTAKARIHDLADKLAVAICYMQAIDDTIDPFAEANPDEAWDVVTLVMQCRKEIADGQFNYALDNGREQLISDARAGRKPTVRDTPVYHEALNIVRRMMKRVE